jgi:WD40 repeat protein
MFQLDPQRWKRVAPHLDVALEMSRSERAHWLSSLRDRDAELAADLETLLDEHGKLGEDGFLERAPAPLSNRFEPRGSDSPLQGDVPRYVLEGEHARGGMGRILRATDTYLERTVAIKELVLDDEKAEARFVREAKLTARLEHPSVVPVHDAGRWQASGKLFYSMKLVAGRSLYELVEGMGSLRERLGLMSSVLAAAEAVAYAHSERIIHRDLKPANVLVGDYGETLVVDWGLAKELSSPNSSNADVERARQDEDSRPAGMTAVGTVLGTPSFMPPEQARGLEADQRSDVYALGAMLYFVLSARAPYQGETSDVLEKVLSQAPLPLRQLEPETPGDLCAIVEKAMARVPSARYPSAAEFAADLRRFTNGQLVSAREYSWRQLLGRWARRHRGIAILAGAFVMAAIVGTGAFVSSQQQLRRSAEVARDRAQSERNRADREALALLEDRGRDELERGHPFRAAVYLAEAFKQVPQSLRHRALLSEAVQGMDAVRWLSHEHTSAIRSISFSHDDKRILTASLDGTGRIFDADSGTVLRTFHVDGEMTCSAFSPDDRKFDTVSAEGSLQIWDAATGELVAEGRGPPGAVSSCPFRPNGREILTAPEKGRARVWSAQNAALLSVLPGSTRGTSPGSGYSPNGRLILLSFPDGTIRVFEARSRRLVYSLEGHGLLPRATSFSPDGRYIVVGDDDGVLRVREAATGYLVRELRGHGNYVRHVEWGTVDQEGILSTSVDGSVRQWIWQTGWSATAYRGELGIMLKASWAKKDTSTLVVSDDGMMRLVIDVDGDVGFAVDLPARRSVTAVVMNHGGNRAAAAAEDGTVYLVDVGGRLSIVAQQDRMVQSVEYSPEGDRLAVGEELGNVSLVELDTGTVGSFHAHAANVLQAIWSPDGHRLLTLPDDERADSWPKIWALERAALVQSPALQGSVTPSVTPTDRKVGPLIRALTATSRASGAAFDPSGQIIATAGQDQTVRFWDGQTGAPQAKRLEAAGQAVAFGPDGTTIATGGSKILIWDVASATVIRELEGHRTTRIHTLECDQRGTRLLSSGWDDHVAKIWDTSTGQLLVNLEGHTRRLTAAKFSPEGDYVATASLDGTARLWDAKSGDLLRIIRGPARAIDFSPDGSKLATSVGNGVMIWDVTIDRRSPDELAAYVGAKSPWSLVDGRLVLH